MLPGPIPAYARDLEVVATRPGLEAAICFSALPTEEATELEPALAAAGHVVASNASSHRMAEDVPLLIPEVNPGHTALVAVQRRLRGWSGALVTNPNCTATGLTMALRPLHDAFGVRQLMVVSLQALSGAGYPGVPSLDIVDNVIPHIGGEEEKVEREPQKMLGRLAGDRIEPAGFITSAHTNRVAVTDGHLVCASVALGGTPGADDVVAALRAFRPPDVVRGLPSAPERPIVVREEADRPQPRRDRDEGDGMSAVVGRVRADPLLGTRFVVLSHNTIRGAAGASILNAELLVAQGLV
jgi:aspartate-semialdehyde dehydrogenase